MKVALLNDSFPPVIDGVANVVLNYADVLTKENLADVMVCTPKYPGTDYLVYPYKVVPYMSFDTTKIVKGYRAGNPFDFKELNDMGSFEPDIIHTHCPVASTYVSRMLRAITDAPIVFTYHTKFDEDIAKAVKSEFLQKETAKVLANNIESCDEVWVVSNGAGENMRSLGYQGDYRVMNNGVDFAKGRVAKDEVEKVVKDYKRVLPEAVIYVYDNNSSDDTVAIAKEAGAVVRHEYVQGKGNVIRRMFREIDAHCYVMVDGDDTYPAEEALKLIEPVLEGRADMVIGDRLSSTYHKENKRAFHSFGNNLVKGLINFLFKSNIYFQ